MAEYRSSWLLTAFLIWPIIVNAQPGTSFVLLGIDWKADNLDSTLFWIGITFVIILLLNISLGQYNTNKKDRKKHRYEEEI